MRATLNIFAKDAFEFFHDIRAIALVLVLPPLLLVLVGQLRSQAFPFRLLVVGVPPDVHTAPPRSEEVRVIRDALTLLGELSALSLTTRAERAVNPLATMHSERWDVLLDVGCDATGCPPARNWRLYTAETDPSRLANLKAVVAGLERALRLEGRGDPQAAKKPRDMARLHQQLQLVATALPFSLFVYYPLAGDRSLWLLPMAVALIVCFLPFALAVSSLIREKEARTLEILLTAPGVRPWTLFAGKCLLPVVMTCVELLVMITVIQSIYHLQIKPGVVETALFVVPAALAATLLGLLVSAVATSQSQALLASVIYFLALTLITGLLLPIREASPLIQHISRLLPLTFVLPALRAWMFGAHPVSIMGEVLISLSLQCVLFGVLASVAFRHALRRI